jgi:hypothetical protein
MPVVLDGIALAWHTTALAPPTWLTTEPEAAATFDHVTVPGPDEKVLNFSALEALSVMTMTVQVEAAPIPVSKKLEAELAAVVFTTADTCKAGTTRAAATSAAAAVWNTAVLGAEPKLIVNVDAATATAHVSTPQPVPS